MKIRPLTPSATPPGTRLAAPTPARSFEPAESYQAAPPEARPQPARLKGLLRATGALGLAALGLLGGVVVVGGGLSAGPGPSVATSIPHPDARPSLDSEGPRGLAQPSQAGSVARPEASPSGQSEAGPDLAQPLRGGSGARPEASPSLESQGGPGLARLFRLTFASQTQASPSLEAEAGPDLARSFRLTFASQAEAPSSPLGWLLASDSGGPGIRATFGLPDPSPAPEPQRPPRTLPDKPPRPVPMKGDYVKHGVNFSHLLSDQEFADADFMTQDEIQGFLEKLDSHLARYQEGGRSAAQIIAEAARRHEVNPLVILSTLEKETSLVSATSSPPRWRMRSAMGYGYHDGGGRPRKSSFAWQVDKGTELLRQLFDEARSGVSFPTTLRVDYGRHRITVRNAATYALYRYTPHTVDTGLGVVGGGNYNFRSVYQRFYSGYARLLQEQA
ncbi:MAG TPA: hypothetical protein VNO81_01355, partial [Candidatus Nitrosotenuis sp.]|nr:hypothetical protein [Candidatus Nitrosotenuis sp.]